MQQTGKSTHTSLGAAFFIFLGLAAIPFSLRAVGLKEALSPRLAAATDAWRQVADAFGGGYQASNTEVAAMKHSDGEASSDPTENRCSARQGSAGALVRIYDTSADNVEVARRAHKPAGVRRNCRQPLLHSDIVKAALLAPARGLEALDSIRMEAAVEREWVKVLKEQMRGQNLRSLDETHRSQMQNRLKVVVQMKSPALSRKAAECKVQAALASATLLDPQRARLVTAPIAGQDNCEL
jgi:hypothetical protein